MWPGQKKYVTGVSLENLRIKAWNPTSVLAVEDMFSPDLVFRFLALDVT